jgi:peptidyl-prolyl cis-trans isomerase SurA
MSTQKELLRLPLLLVALATLAWGQDPSEPAATPPREPAAYEGPGVVSDILIKFRGAELFHWQFNTDLIALEDQLAIWAHPRTRAEARKRAEEARARLVAGEEFHALLEEYGEEPVYRQSHGIAAVFSESSAPEDVEGMLPGIFAWQVLRMKPGEVSPVIETPFGFHVLRRSPVVRTRHICIRYEGRKGVERTSPQWRPRGEALAMIQQLEARLRRGESFEELARTHSEDSFTAARGGEQAPWVDGLPPHAFARAALRLRPGEISPVVEDDFGFHLIQRIE